MKNVEKTQLLNLVEILSYHLLCLYSTFRFNILSDLQKLGEEFCDDLLNCQK